jgi:hypothetical protein
LKQEYEKSKKKPNENDGVYLSYRKEKVVGIH